MQDEINFEFLELSIEHHVAVITLDHSARHNALSQEVLLELAAAFELVVEDPQVRAMVITGSGKVFSVGEDLEQLCSVQDIFAAREYALLGQTVLSELAALPFPTVAAINGIANGSALELALACDLRVMQQGARAGLGQTKMGLIAGFGGLHRLNSLIGRAKTLELVYTSKLLGAQECEQWGISNATVANALEGALELCRLMVANSPVANALAKETLGRGADLSLAASLEVEADMFGMACMTKDFKEGTAAAMAKRVPEFTGE